MVNKQQDSVEEKGSKTISIGLVGFGGIGKLHTANWSNLHLYYPDLPVTLKLRGAAARTKDSADQLLRCRRFDVVHSSFTFHLHILREPGRHTIDQGVGLRCVKCKGGPDINTEPIKKSSMFFGEIPAGWLHPHPPGYQLA